VRSQAGRGSQSLGIAAGLAVAVAGCAAGAVVAGGTHAGATHAGATHAGAVPQAGVDVIASGLNQPKKLTVAPNGSLIVALSGDGAAPASCTNGDQASCLGRSGAIDEVSTSGRVQTLLTGLPSVSSGATAGDATGPAQARIIAGRLQVLFQDDSIDDRTGREPYGAGASLLGDLVRISDSGASRTVEASFGPFEAAHNPDHSAGTDVARHREPGIDSDPYSFVPYRGGYAVADAGGDDLLFVSRTGRISILAVFRTIAEKAAPGTFGSSQTRMITARAQAVPDAVAVGPDGALYVGELGGTPFDVGRSSVYRVVPGHAPTVYAGGLTAIADVAFDSHGRLLVLEIDQQGLDDPALRSSGPPAAGAIIRVNANKSRTLVASKGLEFPTGIAVAPGGAVYVADDGIADANPDVPGSGGEIVKVEIGQ
jgi:hypothetical protein